MKKSIGNFSLEGWAMTPVEQALIDGTIDELLTESPFILLHILNLPIMLCRDNRSFIDSDGVRKMAFTVEDLTQVPEEYRKECQRI